ncbi:inositol monophosphatase family protein, partial [Micrococcus luteus]|uniref:inositol monophosphatase family protein n=1 Tax=Micrococcus luteus TaxID=1270 RepID=UPI0024AF2A41
MSPALPCPAELRAIALDAARAVVGDLAAAFRSPAATGPEAKTTHHDLVTVHDRRTEARLVAALTTAVPGSGVLGEELGAQAGTGEAARLTWIVDPIDGTSNFAHGFAMFSVSLAAEVDGEVVAGVVLDPVGGLAFSADADGAYGTGTGKSLAYLIPALQHAMTQEDPVVVATATLALQAQIMKRD